MVLCISWLHFYPQCQVHSPVVPGQWARLLKDQRKYLNMTCKVYALLRIAYTEGPLAKGWNSAFPESPVVTGWADEPLLHTVLPEYTVLSGSTLPESSVCYTCPLFVQGHLDEHFCLHSALICTSYYRRERVYKLGYRNSDINNSLLRLLV